MMFHLRGATTQAQMLDALTAAIHQFAKRQDTWFRRMERQGIEIHWLDGADAPELNARRPCLNRSRGGRASSRMCSRIRPLPFGPLRIWIASLGGKRVRPHWTLGRPWGASTVTTLRPRYPLESGFMADEWSWGTSGPWIIMSTGLSETSSTRPPGSRGQTNILRHGFWRPARLSTA